MEALKNIYLRTVDGLGDMPSLKKDWRWALIWSLCIYAIVLAFRLSFAGRWDHPELWVNGERLLSTHDAYFWLAQAKGVAVGGVHTLGRFVKLIHDLFGLRLGDIAFWGPAIISALLGSVCYLWGWHLNGRHAGLFAGLVGSITPGFFYRSRLGYFDTDLFTLLGPMLIVLMLSVYVSFWTKRAWVYEVRAEEETETRSLAGRYGVAFAFGLVTRFFCMWHIDILNVSILCFFLAVGVLLINARRGARPYGMYGLVIYLFAAFPGASYLALGKHAFVPNWAYGLESSYIILAILISGCLIVAHKKKVTWVDNVWVGLLCLCGAVWLTDIAAAPVSAVASKLVSYFGGHAGGGGAGMDTVAASGVAKPVFPSIIQSIIEAKLVPVGEVLQRGAFFGWLGWISLASFIVVTIVRPAAIFLFPLIALQLLSVKLGVRFSMFGGAALMVCVGAGLSILVTVLTRRLRSRVAVLVGLQVILGGAILTQSYLDYSKIPLTPVFSRAHAEALIELGERATGDSVLWTWWDWGYASQYYAGLQTNIDGGSHSGKEVFPTAFVLSTDSYIQANAMIRTAAKYKKDREKSVPITDVWSGMPAKEVMAQIEGMTSEDQTFPPVPPQYLVVSWKDMNIIKWITYFGNWNLQTGKTSEAVSGNYDPGELGINIQRGAVMNRKGGGGLVKDITMLDWNSSQSQSYFMNSMSPQLLPKRQHLLINKVSRQSVLMDRIGYGSLMRKLFTEDPNDPEISKYFKIVVDKLPFARIYEVIQ